MKRQSNKKDRLQPQLTHKIQSKLLFASKQINTFSTHVLSRVGPKLIEQELQKEYNQKFMTDRKRKMSSQKSQKSLSSSKITSKQLRPSNNSIIPQRLVFQGQDYRNKYFELHDTYIRQRQKNIEHTQKILGIKQSLCSFLNSPESKTAHPLEKQLQNSQLRQAIRRTIQKRRKYESVQSIIQEVMSILKINILDDIVPSLRVRIERFKNLDECTYRILQLQSINQKVVNDFQQRLKMISLEHEEHWHKERELFEEQLQALKQTKMCLQTQNQHLREENNGILAELNKLVSEQNPNFSTSRSVILETQKLIKSLKNKLQQIEVQAEDNMFRLLKSNEEMMKLQRNISQIRGEMEQQIQELQQKNQQNLCQINHLHTQLQQSQLQIQYWKVQASKSQEQKNRSLRQRQDELQLMASTLGFQEKHPAKIILKIKQQKDKIRSLQSEIISLKTAIQDKDSLHNELNTQVSRLKKQLQQSQQLSKTSVYQKQQYKFLLNNLRDQVSEMKKQHAEQKNRIIKQKDQQIVRSNQDILESHAILTQQLAQQRGQFTKNKIQLQEFKSNSSIYKTKSQQLQKLLNEKQAIIKKMTVQCDRYRKQLRQIESSFRQVVELEEVTSKKAILFEHQKQQNLRMLNVTQQRNGELAKANNELTHQRNTLKTELSKNQNDLRELKEQRVKLQALNMDLRLELLNKHSQVCKMEQSIKSQEKQSRMHKSNCEKLSTQINSLTKKLINLKKQYKNRTKSYLQTIGEQIRILKYQNQVLVKQIRKEKQQISNSVNNLQSKLLQQIALREKNRLRQIEKQKETQREIEKQKAKQGLKQKQENQRIDRQKKTLNLCQSNCQTDPQAPSISKQLIFNKLTPLLTLVSLLRGQKREIQQHLQQLQNFKFQTAFQLYFQDSFHKRIKIGERSIDIIQQQSMEQSQIIDQAQLFQPDQIITDRIEDEINYILQTLLDDDQIPNVSYWGKIEANYLTLRRKIMKKGNLRLDISAIDCKDPSITSPLSCQQESELFRKIGTEPDDLFDPRQMKDTNRSDRQITIIQNYKKENQQLRSNLDQLHMKLQEEQMEMQELKGKLVKLQNQTSIIGLQHNFKKIIDYLLTDNIDLFVQTCRIVMKMLHFSDLQIKDFQQKIDIRKKKKKNGLFSGFFNKT